MRRTILLGLLLAGGLAPAPRAMAQDKWEPQIAAFEKADQENPPAPGGVVFAGSSSVRGYNLGQWFPEAGFLNRGFGGSVYRDLVRYADRMILPYQPSLVVLYAGDNDVARGMIPERIVADFAELVAIVREALPETRIVVMSVKLSESRWAKRETILRTNALLRGYAEAADNMAFVDVATPLLGDDGRPRPELFKDDKLHLSSEGYRVWTDTLKPFLP